MKGSLKLPRCSGRRNTIPPGHLNEYTSVDVEMGYVTSVETLMETETYMLKSMFSYLKEEYEEELALLKVSLPDLQEIPAFLLRKSRRLWRGFATVRVTDPEDLEPERRKKDLPMGQRKDRQRLCVCDGIPGEKAARFYSMESKDIRN